MTVINAVGNALTGSTGSGAFAGSTSPVFVTPNIGAALLTSLSFGVTALNYFEENTFNPTFTCATPGDLSVVYNTQLGYFERFNTWIFFVIYLNVTPTFTTASGNIRIGSLPYNDANGNSYPPASIGETGFTVPAGLKFIALNPVNGQSYAEAYYTKSVTALTAITMANLTSGSPVEIFVGQGMYQTS